MIVYVNEFVYGCERVSRLCTWSKGYMAQMMRIYIVTPDGPLRVSVNPLIQPAPHPCPTFHPGVGQEIDLSPGSLWVLRLPYPLSK